MIDLRSASQVGEDGVNWAGGVKWPPPPVR